MTSGRDEQRRDRIRWFYSKVLALYPRDFRDQYAEDLLQAFDDRRAEPRFTGGLGGVRLLLFLSRDFVVSIPMARNDNSRRRGWDGMMSDILHDLRFSARMLLKNPMFTVTAVTTLALGIGMNAATFSAIHGILLRPLAGAHAPDELVQLYRQWPGIEFGSNSVPHYQDVRDRSSDFFSNVATWGFQPVSISSDGRNERTMAMVVSANFFQTYGVEPALGRAFIPGVEDRDPGAHPVAVIGHGMWQSRFGSDPDVLGTTMLVNGTTFEVVGVSPPDFKGPLVFTDVPIYLPLMMSNVLSPAFNQLEARGSNSLNAVGRLQPGISINRAGEGMDAMLLQLRDEYPDSYDNQLGTTLVLQSQAGIHPSFGAAQVGMSSVMMGVVALLLLIACLNVANLFLARARDRRREMGIRLSLGAGRGRIIQQLLTESLLFSVVAGAAGLGLAAVAVRMLSRFQPPMDGPFSMAVEMDNTVLAFTLVISIGAGFVFGMAPALQAARPQGAALKGGSGNGPGRSRMSSGLVVVQVALSLLLLISSGLFLRALQSATSIDPGFDDPANVAIASVDPGLQGYDEVASTAFWDRMLEETAALPEVASVGLSLAVPLGFSNSDRGIAIPGYEFAEGEPSNIHYTYVSEGYVETLGIELIEGRTFERSDDANGAPAIVINQHFADRFWPGESAIGKAVRTAGQEWAVIGVVETGKYQSLGEDPREYMYLPYRALFRSDMILVARTTGDPQVVLRRIRELVRSADSNLPVYDVRSLEEHMGTALLPARLGGWVLGIFGLLGLTLAAVGIYGVMAYSVAQRRRELGIRVALGADRGLVLRLVLKEGMRLAIIGTALGLVAAVGATRLMQGLLYDVSAIDPVAFTLVPVLLMLVAALAVYLPAHRAAGVDPIGALKAE